MKAHPGVKLPIQRQAGLQAEVGGVFHVQHGAVGADIDRHVFRHVNFVFDVEVLLKTDEVALADQGVQGVFLSKIQFKLQRPG